MDLVGAQTERCFQKQPTIFLNKKRVAGARAQRVSDMRYVRNVGLGFKAPATAKETKKMNRTITIRRDYLHFIKKYNRFEKRHSKLSAHMSPAFLDVEVGDSVTVGQCRPLSKTVCFNVLKTEKLGGKK